MPNCSGNASAARPTDTMVEVANSLVLVGAPMLLILGTIGNVLSMVVFSRRKMRSSSSFILVALAVADTLVLYSGLMFTWIANVSGFDVRKEYDWVCKTRAFFMYACHDIAAWILVLVTLQRLYSVIFPLRAASVCTIKNGRIAVSTIVIFFIVLHLHFFWTVGKVPKGCGKFSCKELPEFKFFITKVWPWIDMAFLTIIPFIILITSNTLILFKLIRAQRRRTCSMNVNIESQSIDERKMTVMLLTVSFGFLILTCPMTVFYIGLEYWRKSLHFTNSQMFMMRSVFLLMYNLNSAVNFLLYSACGQVFRRELRALCCGKKPSARSGTYMSTLKHPETTITSVGGRTSCNNTNVKDTSA